MPDLKLGPPPILLVEDEPDILNLLQLLVRRWAAGYEVLTANSSAAALEAFEARPALLVITDYNMPGMNGLQLTSAIKSRVQTTRVVLITAYPSAALERTLL